MKRYIKQSFRGLITGIVALLFIIHTPVTFAASNEEIQQKPLNADILFALVNDYRAKLKLSPFQRDPNLCDLVAKRASQLYNEIFMTGSMHQGFREMNLPYWASENIVSSKTEEQALTWWLNSPIHKRSIESTNKFSCSVCKGKECSQIYTSYEPKPIYTLQIPQ